MTIIALILVTLAAGILVAYNRDNTKHREPRILTLDKEFYLTEISPTCFRRFTEVKSRLEDRYGGYIPEEDFESNMKKLEEEELIEVKFITIPKPDGTLNHLYCKKRCEDRETKVVPVDVTPTSAPVPELVPA